ncbi:MAG TPA: tetratricopeptide repeat protein [Chitinophagaceae bacterium]|nr:tetratricopeptide repeat protein [Chitinophagaceae bacterium]
MIYADQDRDFREGREFFQEGKYAVAMVQFKKIIDQIGYFHATNRQLVLQDATYYYDICALELDQPYSEKEVSDFIEQVHNQPRDELASYYLARHYYHQNRFADALPYYEKAGIQNLSNAQIADAQFEQAYCYFNLREFTQAEPLFNAIKDLPGKYYVPANYYYGFIAFDQKEYDQALTSFQRIEKVPKYDIIVPYYIAEIYYSQHRMDELIQYATPFVQKGNLYYDLDLKHLLGQAYFEKKDYAHALPYLEAYYNQASRVSKEDVYELSYCYYQTGAFQKAVAGFRQLSPEKDSLGQNAMYLLANCYLKTGQKGGARSAFGECARYDYSPLQQEISIFNYGKLSYELGYEDVAIQELEMFNRNYPQSAYLTEAREILAHLFINTNDYRDALSVLESIVDKSPDMQKAYQKIAYGRALQLLNDQRLDEADSLLSGSLRFPQDRRLADLSWFWKGEIAYRQDRTDDALSDLNKYQTPGSGGLPASSGQANPQTAEYNMGYCLLKKEDYATALNDFKNVQSYSGPGSRQIAQDALLREADCYYMLRDYGDALTLYDRIISGHLPGSDYALYQKSIITGINGDYSAKVSLLQQLSTQYPTSSLSGEAGYEIATTYMNNQQYRSAIPYLKTIIQKTPPSPDAPKALLQLGLAYFNLNDNTEALQSYQNVVTQYPSSPEVNDALQAIRNIDVANGDPGSYVSFLKSTGRTVNASVEDSVNFSAAETRFGNGDYPGALQAFNNYLSQFPSGQFVLEANFYKAECLYAQKQYAAALPGYEAVLAGGNSRFSERSAAMAAAICYFQAKDYSRARTYYLQLRQEATTRENALSSLRGLVLCDFQLQDWADMKADAPALLASGNTSTDDQIMSYFYLAKAYKAEQNCDSAILTDRTVIALTKSEMGAEARYDIAECFFEENDLKDAEPAAFDVIKSTPSYDYWIAKAYILLGDIYTGENDYFNASATLQSVADHCTIPELAQQARQKLAQVQAAQKASSKISDNPQDSTGKQP